MSRAAGSRTAPALATALSPRRLSCLGRSRGSRWEDRESTHCRRLEYQNDFCDSDVEEAPKTTNANAATLLLYIKLPRPGSLVVCMGSNFNLHLGVSTIALKQATGPARLVRTRRRRKLLLRHPKRKDGDSRHHGPSQIDSRRLHIGRMQPGPRVLWELLHGSVTSSRLTKRLLKSDLDSIRYATLPDITQRHVKSPPRPRPCH